jgi:general secretion pathway protein N
MNANLFHAPTSRPARMRWGLGLTGVLLACGAGLSFWPAAWVTPVIERLSTERVQLKEVRGSMWNGSAWIALGNPGGTAVAWPQRIHWQLRPASFNAWHLGVRTDPESTRPVWQGKVRWQPSGWRIEFDDLEFRMPSDWLSALGAPWNTIAPQGHLRVQSKGWGWQQDGSAFRMNGQVTLTLEGLSTRLSSLRPLGDYQVSIQGGVAPSLELTTLQGPLQMSGKGLWHRGRLDFQGEAWARQADDEAVLANLLSALGPRKGTRAMLKVG